MKHALKMLLATLIGLAVVFSSARDARAAISYDLSYLINNGSSPGGTPPWLTATFTSITSGADAGKVQLTILNNLDLTSEFTTKFGFNVLSTYSPTSLTVSQQNNGFAVGTAMNPLTTVTTDVQNAQDLPGVKGFDVLLEWGSSNANSGQQRFNQGDSLVFFISRSTGALVEGDFDFLNNDPNTLDPDPNSAHVAAHIQGINGNPDSGVIGDLAPPDPVPPVVPEPSTLVLGSLGSLVGLALVWARRKEHADVVTA